MAATRRWLTPEPSGRGRAFADLFQLHGTAADLLHERTGGDADAAERYLSPRLTDLRRPSEMAGMKTATARVAQALQEGQAILVYGDYDVDGQCGTALLVDFLRRVGGRVDYFVPDRMTDGYGLSEGGVRTVAGREPDLLITVDCGIGSPDEVSLAKSLGMDVIICDHHPPSGALPDADAVLNPHRADCGFADRLPCATGVAFNLICGVRALLDEQPNLKVFMDLVALATIADVVPLLDHNRVLVAHGLEVISLGVRPGLAALCAVSGLAGPVSAEDVAFKLAPRLNAAGRLGDASRGVELMLAADPAAARRLAEELNDENDARRRITKDVFDAAVDEVERGELDRSAAVVVGRPGWHPGVAGIVAARLVERYGRPSVVVGFEDDEGKGSARTIGGFDVGAAMRSCEEHLVAGGGHAGAAGLTVRQESFDDFRRAFVTEAEAGMPEGGYVVEVEVAAEVGLGDVDGSLVDDLGRLEPFGKDNPEPVFAARGVWVDEVRVLKGEHLKCTLRDADGGDQLRSAIGFGLADQAPAVGDRVDVAFSVGWNVWRGKRELQLTLEAIRPSEPGRSEEPR